MFTVTSRYYGLPVLTLTPAGGGSPIQYVARRLLPNPGTLALIGTYVVGPADRLDLIANSQLGDPQQAWRIADAARVLDPDALTEVPGTVLRITLPAGVAGSPGSANG